MSSFRAANGNWFTRGLFYETTMSDKSTVLYTLKEQDHEGYPSLYRLYMEVSDPTEYNFATTYLEGWSHWIELSTATFFKPYVEAWRRELSVKIRSLSLVQIRAMAGSSDTKVSFAANKYLLDGNWVETTKRRRGAPSKDEISSEAKKIAEAQAQVQSDFERIMQ